MTAADRLRREGYQKGYQEGYQRGRVECALEYLPILLEARFGPLPAAVQAAIAGAEQATLDRWFKQSIMACTLDEVFGDRR